MRGAELHAGVDRSRLESRPLEEPDRVEEIGEEQAVDDEPGLVRDFDHGLAEQLAERSSPLANAGRGGRREAQLDELHLRHGVEDMEAEEPLRAPGRGRQRGDAERGGRRR